MITVCFHIAADLAIMLLQNLSQLKFVCRRARSRRAKKKAGHNINIVIDQSIIDKQHSINENQDQFVQLRNHSTIIESDADSVVLSEPKEGPLIPSVYGEDGKEFWEARRNLNWLEQLEQDDYQLDKNNSLIEQPL